MHPDHALVKTSTDSSRWQAERCSDEVLEAYTLKLNFWNVYESNLTEARFNSLPFYLNNYGNLTKYFLQRIFSETNKYGVNYTARHLSR